MTKSWLSPAIFHSVFWIIMMIIPLLFASEFTIHVSGLWAITMFCLSLLSGAGFANLINKKKYLFYHLDSINSVKIFFLILCTISISGVILLFKYSLSIYKVNFSLVDVLTIPNLISIDRYEGLINYPNHIKYSIYCIYPSSLISGLFLGLNVRFFSKAVLIIPLVCSIVLGFIEGTRSGILICLILYISSYMASIIIADPLYKNNKKLNFKSVIFFITVPISFISVFISIQWLRQGLDEIVFELIYIRIKAYFFGYLSAFSIWFEESNTFQIDGGLNTFAGFFSLLGWVDRSFGYYDPVQISTTTETNIFTVYRGIINDFSLYGALILFFFVGYFFEYVFKISSKGSLVHISLLSSFYAFTLFSPLISIFHYNSVTFSWIILITILVIFKRK